MARLSFAHEHTRFVQSASHTIHEGERKLIQCYALHVQGSLNIHACCLACYSRANNHYSLYRYMSIILKFIYQLSLFFIKNHFALFFQKSNLFPRQIFFFFERPRQIGYRVHLKSSQSLFMIDSNSTQSHPLGTYDKFNLNLYNTCFECKDFFCGVI